MDSQGSILDRPDGNLFVPRRGILREDFELDAHSVRLKIRGQAVGFPVAVYPWPHMR
jgi:hypothetical protein